MKRLIKKRNVLYEELKQIKDLIIAHHPDCKNIFISCPLVCTDNKKANNVLKKYIDILKREEKNVIFQLFFITFLNLTYIGMVSILIVTGLLCWQETSYQGFDVYDVMWIPMEKSYLMAIISHWQQTLNP